MPTKSRPPIMTSNSAGSRQAMPPPATDDSLRPRALRASRLSNQGRASSTSKAHAQKREENAVPTRFRVLRIRGSWTGRCTSVDEARHAVRVGMGAANARAFADDGVRGDVGFADGRVAFHDAALAPKLRAGLF